MMNPRNLFKQGYEIFSYIQLSGPCFPSEQKTTIRAEVGSLISIVNLASDFVRTDDAKRFLGFCTMDLEKALVAYEDNDAKGGRKFLASARHWFDLAKMDKPSKPTFSVGPEGTAEHLAD